MKEDLLFRSPQIKVGQTYHLPWMAFGYGVSVTPMQTLAFYNAVANNGVMIKPRLFQKLKSGIEQ
jgi:cell division protein FtsI (penicillin-binding protein 3)